MPILVKAKHILKYSDTISFDRLCIMYRNHKLHLRQKKASELYTIIKQVIKNAGDTSNPNEFKAIALFHHISIPQSKGVLND